MSLGCLRSVCTRIMFKTSVSICQCVSSLCLHSGSEAVSVPIVNIYAQYVHDVLGIFMISTSEAASVPIVNVYDQYVHDVLGNI